MSRVKTKSPLVVNGWTIFAHPLFLDQLEVLMKQVQELRSKDPAGYTNKNASKRLAAILRLAIAMIPQDPGRSEYRQGNTLGEENRHWCRTKFFQQFRLFFRFRAKERVIVYAWVNDEKTKRTYESQDDAYRVFARMLTKGNPPNDWDQLMNEARSADRRLHSDLSSFSENNQTSVDTNKQ